MSRCTRKWRHLKDMKRGGAGHTTTPVKDLGDGSLAVECPACPHPGRNLPPGWENADEDKAYAPFYLNAAVPDNHPSQMAVQPHPRDGCEL